MVFENLGLISGTEHDIRLIYQFLLTVNLLNVFSDLLNDLDSVFVWHLEIKQHQVYRSDINTGSVTDGLINDLLTFVDGRLSINTHLSVLKNTESL